MNTTSSLTAEQNQLVVLGNEVALTDKEIKKATQAEARAIKAAERKAGNEIKAFEFEINQEGFSYRYQLAGKSKDFNFSFIMGERTISTLQAQSQLNLKLKVGYKAEKRRSFEAVLSLIIDEVLRGSNLYTVEEVNALDGKLTALLPAQSN